MGRAIVVAWPISHWSTLPLPATFSQSGIGTQALGLASDYPGALAFAGALPLTYLQRRWRLRRGRGVQV